MFDFALYLSALVILGASIYLSFRTRFIQIRMLPHLVRSIFRSTGAKRDGEYIVPLKALCTAMSTTIGLGTMISPIIAIRLGGPGALLGYVLTTIFGAAATFAEVSLAVQYRERSATGAIFGGPMGYLKQLISPKLAAWYAFCCFILMTAWSGAQMNQLAQIFASPMMGTWAVPAVYSGAVVALVIVIMLIGGIHWIAEFAGKKVPLMFVIYIGACLWIIGTNIEKIPSILALVFKSCFEPYALSSGACVGGIVSALRWGTFKGIHSNEAGIGTQTIPHSMSASSDGMTQGILAMASTYSAGLISILSGLVALITGTWMQEGLGLGISMVASSFELFFGKLGIAIVAVSALLEAFGAILGNSYNGSSCFLYLTKGRWRVVYFCFTAFVVFSGALSEVTLFWAMSDIVLACVAIPNVLALVYLAMKGKVETEQELLFQS